MFIDFAGIIVLFVFFPFSLHLFIHLLWDIFVLFPQQNKNNWCVLHETANTYDGDDDDHDHKYMQNY